MTTGHCLCGAIRYEYDGRADAGRCTAIAKVAAARPSSPVATFVMVPKTALRFTRGQPKEFASSPGVRAQLLRRVRFADLLPDRQAPGRSSTCSPAR